MKSEPLQRTNEAVSRLRATCDLADFGIELMRQNIRRALPEASEEIISRELDRWLFDQPKNFVPRMNE